MKNLPLVVKAIRDFNRNSHRNLFFQIFGHMGSHLYEKYEITFKGDFLAFFSYLDAENQKILTDYFESTYHSGSLRIK